MIRKKLLFLILLALSLPCFQSAFGMNKKKDGSIIEWVKEVACQAPALGGVVAVYGGCLLLSEMPSRKINFSIELKRKMLSELAIFEPKALVALAEGQFNGFSDIVEGVCTVYRGACYTANFLTPSDLCIINDLNGQAFRLIKCAKKALVANSTLLYALREGSTPAAYSAYFLDGCKIIGIFFIGGMVFCIVVQGAEKIGSEALKQITSAVETPAVQSTVQRVKQACTTIFNYLFDPLENLPDGELLY